MRLDEKKFFTETLDERIPAVKEAADLYRRGEREGAVHAFAAYARSALRTETYDRIPCVQDRIASPAEREKTVAQADRVLDGWVSSCGFPWQFPGGVVDWDANPTPNRYCEWTWQLSRHHEFYILSNAYRLTGDEKYARRFADMIDSWIRQEEVPGEDVSGFHTLAWRTIEAGIRMFSSWPFAIHTFLRSPAVDDGLVCRIFASVWEHANRLHRRCTSHNWLIMEMSGMLHICLLYPFYRACEEWREFAFGKLTDSLTEQIYPDGFQYELTTGYHGVVINNYADVVDAYTTFSAPVPPAFMQGLRSLFSLYPKIVLPDNTLPDLNDGTEGDIARMAARGLRYFPDDGALRYLATHGREGEPPAFTSIALPFAGIMIFRTGWGKDATWALFESGPFGKAHQHEDKLSFDLYAYGKKLLTDGGSYDYDTSDMRKFVLSTRAHNTAMVDREGQNRRQNYRWDPADIRKTSDLRWRVTPDYEVAEGSYCEGYGPDHIPVTHRRKVIHFRAGLPGVAPFFLLLDTFTPGDGEEHLYEILFQLGAEPITAEGRRVTVHHPDGVSLGLVSTAAPKILIGQYKPRYMGWRKLKATGTDHEHIPAPAVLFTGAGKDYRAVTAICPAAGGEPAILSVSLTADGFVLHTREGGEYAFRSDDPRFATGKGEM